MMNNKEDNPSRKAIEALERVRIAMRLIGAEVVERPLPQIVLGDRDYYRPSEHLVVLHVGDAHALVHELVHSQQPALVGLLPYQAATSKADHDRLWMVEPREIEAMAVEAIEPHLEKEWLSTLLSILDGAGKTRSELAEWVKWFSKGDISARKPSYVGRSTRMAINRLLRKE